MGSKNLPIFPDAYIGDKASEYDSSKWMERNQKKTTIRTIEYLFDKKLGNIKFNPDDDLPFLILDLGCGSGFSSEILDEYGFRVIGIDILDDMLSKAAEKKSILKNKNINFILADINNLPIKANSIHHIISISAYNFITHGKSSFNEKKKVVNNTAKYLNKILKKQGRIIIEFYPDSEKELDLFSKSFILNGFNGYMIKNNPKQKSGQTFLLMKKDGNM
ncbi:MAG: class I SAM-dependent methyltransferase [Candidatus Hermodarchaeota archaeon]